MDNLVMCVYGSPGTGKTSFALGKAKGKTLLLLSEDGTNAISLEDRDHITKVQADNFDQISANLKGVIKNPDTCNLIVWDSVSAYYATTMASLAINKKPDKSGNVLNPGVNTQADYLNFTNQLSGILALLRYTKKPVIITALERYNWGSISEENRTSSNWAECAPDLNPAAVKRLVAFVDYCWRFSTDGTNFDAAIQPFPLMGALQKPTTKTRIDDIRVFDPLTVPNKRGTLRLNRKGETEVEERFTFTDLVEFLTVNDKMRGN